MKMVEFSDCTLQQAEGQNPLSFREKIEICRQIDRLELSSVELQPIQRSKADSLLIKSVVSAVRNTAVIVPVLLNAESVAETWNALKGGGAVRLQVRVPVSSVQMEYCMHLKPVALLSAVKETLQACFSCTDQVEFVAEDAMRADTDFLLQAVDTAMDCGVQRLTFHDAAGSMLPEEVAQFYHTLLEKRPALANTILGYAASNALSLSDACAVAAVRCGVTHIKGSMVGSQQVSIPHVARILEAKGTEFNAFTHINLPQLNHIGGQIAALFRPAREVNSFLRESAGEEDIFFTAYDTRDSVQQATIRLGYDLSPEDMEKIWIMVQTIAGQKGRLSLHELDALIAAEAMQVPAAYADVRYMVNTGSSLGAMAHMRIRFRDQELEATAAGDGSIDAAFHAVEQAVGRHLELDDFQIQTVTEGREAMGEALVKLRSDGKLFSGRGVSTDIIGASVMAYISALNKIVYEEEEA